MSKWVAKILDNLFNLLPNSTIEFFKRTPLVAIIDYAATF